MDIFEAIILGIIQGLTEFLPVSSSGHIELGKILLQTEIKEDLLFSAVVHAATALSTVVIYFKDILKIFKDLFRFEWNESTRFVAMILVSMIPAGVVYVTLKDQLDQLFEGNILLVGCMLLVTGVLLILSSRIGQQEPEPVVETANGSNPVNVIEQAERKNLTFPKAFITGCAQAIAILPGISRSGATISTALMQGVDRATAARFSFLMVIPVILGGTTLELKDYVEAREMQTTLGDIWFVTSDVDPAGTKSCLRAVMTFDGSAATCQTTLEAAAGPEHTASLQANLLQLAELSEGLDTEEVDTYIAQLGGPKAATIGPVALIASFFAAFLSGLAACAWMIRLVKKSKLDYFAIYCFIVGIVAILAGLGVF